MTEFFVKATVSATIEAETEAEAQQVLCNRLPDLDRYTVNTVDAKRVIPTYVVRHRTTEAEHRAKIRQSIVDAGKSA